MKIDEMRKKLSELIIDGKYTIGSLAAAVGLGRKSFSNFLSLKRMPNIVTILKIKQFLDKKID